MKKVLKWSVIIVVIFFVGITALGFMTEGQKGGKVNNAFQQGMNQAKQTVDSGRTPEQAIEANVRGAVDSSIVKDVQVTKQGNAGYSVLVNTNEQPGVSNGQTKTGVMMDMGRIYTALYKQPVGVNQAAVVAYMDMVDKYGKTSNEVVMKTSLDKSEAQKVNWNLAQSTLDQDILPNLWMTDTDLLK